VKTDLSNLLLDVNCDEKMERTVAVKPDSLPSVVNELYYRLSLVSSLVG